MKAVSEVRRVDRYKERIISKSLCEIGGVHIGVNRHTGLDFSEEGFRVGP